MKKAFLAMTAVCLATVSLYAQPTQKPAATEKPAAKEDKPSASSRSLTIDTQVVTNGQVTIKGQKVPYKTTAGTLPVWDEEGKTVAGVFFTYFERSDVTDRSTRPLVISFNGGPGTASVWMMIGYTGPRILKVDDEGYPIQPYGIKDNPNSILDVADIVYVDPVNTGFSRPANKDVPAPKLFFGVNADIKYLADWINTFVSRYNRWASPKYLIGESYGTTRVSGLALELQKTHWMYLNGVVLVSPTGLGIERDGPAQGALKLPYFAATAWYHKALPADLQKKDLTEVLPEVENFTIQEYLPALAMAGSLTDQKRKEIAAKVARYSGLSETSVMQQNLDVPTNFFWKELLRSKGQTVGRLDSRYLGMDSKDAGVSPEYNSELTSWLHSFTPAINMFMREELNYKTDLKYYMFGPTFPWDNTNNHTGEDLRQAMDQNPYLHLLVQSGYYDGACDYFNAKYSMWQINASGKLKDRMDWEGYRSGHMMYLRKEDLATSNENLRKFIQKSIPKNSAPAKYSGSK
ncbi:carboxypeptidase [Spirosoma harenae]